MPNIELKVRYENLNFAQETAIQLGGKLLWQDTQIDTYFHTKAGKLKLRQSRLNEAQLIPYFKSDLDGLKRSDYALLPVKDPELVERLFSHLVGQKTRVEKERTVYIISNVRVHVDRVVGLGNFLEFEAVFEDDSPESVAREHQKVNELMREFKVEKDSLFNGSYPDLLGKI